MGFNLLEIECINKKNLQIALTHPSYTTENNISYLKNYERLEFLGDAVLKLITSDLLYKKYPEYKEGKLSKIRSILVSDNTLATIAKDIKLQEKMILGKGEEHTVVEIENRTLLVQWKQFLVHTTLMAKLII